MLLQTPTPLNNYKERQGLSSLTFENIASVIRRKLISHKKAITAAEANEKKAAAI